MSKNNTFFPIEYAAPISDLMNLTKKRLDKRNTIDEQNPADHNDSETSSILFITTDGWTSCRNYSYISETAHFISDKTNFISFCLGFAYLNGRHDADNLKEALLKIVEKFKDDDKIMSIVSDNASNVRNCLNSFKVCLNIQPIRCMGHVLQLVVKNVIDLVEEGEKDSSSKFFFIARTLTKCRKIVTSFNHSSQLNDLLEEIQTRQGVEKNHILHLIQDVKTRWHSTFLMAERMLKLHSYVKDIFNSKQQYKDMRKYLLDEDEMVNIKETVNALLSFSQVSVLLSGDRYATCSLIIPIIKYLEKQLSKNKSETPPLIVILKSHLLESLQTYKDSYELENNSFLLCATFLDPNYKISEIIPIKKVRKESKKFKLSFEDEEDDSGSDSDKNVTLDLKKEIGEYIRLSVHEQNVLEFWHQN
ncbi:uncharacterized protein LOC136086877 [Hydra vulgaris]|uniref:Uncharacterized protein LOC136086877 n=1 Tax=Hydra vulgaris TaxID=6087 RepID=A0ABM4CU37_HYDVU